MKGDRGERGQQGLPGVRGERGEQGPIPTEVCKDLSFPFQSVKFHVLVIRLFGLFTGRFSFYSYVFTYKLICHLVSG